MIRHRYLRLEIYEKAAVVKLAPQSLGISEADNLVAAGAVALCSRFAAVKLFLVEIHLLVGLGQQALYVTAPGGPAPSHRKTPHAVLVPADLRFEFGYQAAEIFLAQIWREHDKLVSAYAVCAVSLFTKDGFHSLRRLDQRQVSRRVSVLIVAFFKAVDVDIDYPQRFEAIFREVFHIADEGVSVMEPRQHVVITELLQAPLIEAALHGAGDKVGEGDEQRRNVQDARRRGIIHAEITDKAAVGRQRRRDKAPDILRAQYLIFVPAGLAQLFDVRYY